jgi:tetratricopeptide (TPR) repeat protein
VRPEQRRLSAVAYERRLLAVLEQVNRGCGAGQVEAVLADLDLQHFCEWFWQWGKALTPGEHPELLLRLGQLAGLGCGQVSAVAKEVGEGLNRPQAESRTTENIEISLPPQVETIGVGDGLLQQGITQLQAKNYHVALELLEQATTHNPSSPDVWYQKGLALQNLGRYSEASAANEKFMALSGSLGKQGQLFGQQDVAQDFLRVSQPNNQAEDWFNRRSSHDRLGRGEESVAHFYKALEVQYDAWFNRGLSLAELGCDEEAIASYEKALEFKSDDYEVWYVLGNSLAKLGRDEEAIVSYNKALEIQPNGYQAWHNRGNSLVNLGRDEEAIASYDKALEIEPNECQVWYGRGNSLANLGRDVEAIASYDKALVKLDDYRVWFDRGFSLANLGRYEEAIASCDKALEIQPSFYTNPK